MTEPLATGPRMARISDRLDEPALDRGAVTERIDLDAASWVDVTRAWLAGADVAYRRLLEGIAWHQGRVFRYERWVDEPRLGAFAPTARLPDPVLVEAQRVLQHRYGVGFDGVAFARYRDGRDSVAFHRDREMRHLEETVVAILSLGARRPFLLRPRGAPDRFLASHGGAVLDLAPAGGDLLVFGGRFQADWEHAVPKVPGLLAGRISLQWRWTSGRGRPVQGASYRAPRHFSRHGRPT